MDVWLFAFVSHKEFRGPKRIPRVDRDISDCTVWMNDWLSYPKCIRDWLIHSYSTTKKFPKRATCAKVSPEMAFERVARWMTELLAYIVGEQRRGITILLAAIWKFARFSSLTFTRLLWLSSNNSSTTTGEQQKDTLFKVYYQSIPLQIVCHKHHHYWHGTADEQLLYSWDENHLDSPESNMYTRLGHIFFIGLPAELLARHFFRGLSLALVHTE